MIIDSHCHVYPKLSQFVDEGLDALPIPIAKEIFETPLTKIEDHVQKLKPKYRTLVQKYLGLLHKMQTESRQLPENLKSVGDKSLSFLSMGNTLFDNNTDDLFSHMTMNNIDYTVLIAHPPYIPNHFILQLAYNHSCFIPFVNIPYNKPGAPELLEHYIELGAKGLKIHAAADGGEVMSDHYLSLLEVASKHKLPVIIHSGCIHIKPVYKDPQMGHAENFEAWFQDYPDTQFVLAHMNYHYPETCIELMQTFQNVHADTSWQPTKAIVKALQTLGNDRIMFGSDWPIVGNNISICLDRILEAHKKELISDEDKTKVLGTNAAKLFKL